MKASRSMTKTSPKQLKKPPPSTARLRKRLQISAYLDTLSQLVPAGPQGPPATQLEVIHQVIDYISALEHQLATKQLLAGLGAARRAGSPQDVASAITSSRCPLQELVVSNISSHHHHQQESAHHCPQQLKQI